MVPGTVVAASVVVTFSIIVTCSVIAVLEGPVVCVVDVMTVTGFRDCCCLFCHNCGGGSCGLRS